MYPPLSRVALEKRDGPCSPGANSVRPDAPARFAGKPLLAWVLPALAVLFLALTRVGVGRAETRKSFLFSALSIVGLMSIFGMANFPYLLPARSAGSGGLTVANSSASQNTLTAMLVIALLGMPLVIAYTAYIYHLFRGKARVEEEGY